MLPYQSQPPRWRRMLNSCIDIATPLANHLIALGITASLLILLPLVIFTLFWLVLVLFSFATPSEDSGGMLFFPAGLLVISIVGLSSTLAICLLNIILECIRKPLRWPIWSSPLIFCVLAWLAALITLIVQKHSFFSILMTPVTFSLGLTFFFSLYWFPLAISEIITDWLRRRLIRWTNLLQ